MNEEKYNSSEDLVDEKYIHIELNSMTKFNFGFLVVGVATVFIAYVTIITGFQINAYKYQLPQAQTDCIGEVDFCYISSNGKAVIKTEERIRKFHRFLTNTFEMSHNDTTQDYETDITWQYTLYGYQDQPMQTWLIATELGIQADYDSSSQKVTIAESTQKMHAVCKDTYWIHRMFNRDGRGKPCELQGYQPMLNKVNEFENYEMHITVNDYATLAKDYQINFNIKYLNSAYGYLQVTQHYVFMVTSILMVIYYFYKLVFYICYREKLYGSGSNLIIEQYIIGVYLISVFFYNDFSRSYYQPFSKGALVDYMKYFQGNVTTLIAMTIVIHMVYEAAQQRGFQRNQPCYKYWSYYIVGIFTTFIYFSLQYVNFATNIGAFSVHPEYNNTAIHHITIVIMYVIFASYLIYYCYLTYCICSVQKQIPQLNYILYLVSAIFSVILMLALVINMLSNQFDNFNSAYGSLTLVRELDCIIINMYSLMLGYFMSARVEFNENFTEDANNEVYKMISNYETRINDKDV